MANYVLQVLNAQQRPLGGAVDVSIRSERGLTLNLRGLDASRDIPILQNQDVPPGIYRFTVTAPGANPVETQVTIGPNGPFTVTVVVPSAPARVQASVQGSIVFDHGLPGADIPVRLYTIGFAGADRMIAEIKTDAQGRYTFSYAPAANIQVRVLDASQKEVAISAIKYKPALSETLNLVAPARVKPLASEFDRLSADVTRVAGGLPALGKAVENADRRDLTLLNRATNWDARLIALAATAAQQTAASGLAAETTPVLYALYRAGLPTDPEALSLVPSPVAKIALDKAAQAGIVTMNADQAKAALTAFETFANETRLAMKTPGAPSTFAELFPSNISAAEQTAFTKVYFDDPTAGASLWDAAARAGVSAPAIESLKLQGKFLYLTYNSAPLAKKLQADIGSRDNLAQLAAKDYHLPETWKAELTSVAGAPGGDAVDKLIPTTYTGATTAARLDAYAADLARKVRISFPTQVTTRMVETNQIPLKNGAGVANVLKAAAPLGYELGKTPLHTFLRKSSAQLPPMDKDTTASLETLHRLYQVTPSPESLEAAVKAGLTSAYHITSYSHADFTDKYAAVLGSAEEADLVYRKSQQVTSVTFNFFSMAKQIDTAPPIYGISAPDSHRQSAKDAIVQQFPSMASLFGSLDFCQCEDCRSVLSPAAYFVDLLEFLRKSGPNAKGYTPIDVLVGKDATVPGRRPDLAALPLTCENTNTALPYIDLVNEVFEYYIAHNSLDRGVAYDTGDASTADLSAEPQHTIAQVYTSTLTKAVYPVNLPFDLWMETVRGFLDYFKAPLSQVLDTMRPVDQLELFTDAAHVYYRAQILSEALSLSPAEYAVLTAFPPKNWFQLYGYTSEPAAIASLTSAKTLAGALGLTYQELTDLLTTGFWNPALTALVYQFRRFKIDLHTAFAYTGQPGYAALSAADKTAFETQLNAITAQYKLQNPASTFDAIAWLKALLPANYSKTVLILQDPDTGCNFNSTKLQYADGSSATPLDFLKLNLFVRLWKRLGWTMDETDRALQTFFPKVSVAFADTKFPQAFGDAWKTALVYLAHLDELNTRLSPTSRTALLPLWSDIAVAGVDPQYADLFLSPGVLANDAAFDDPAGVFPWNTNDPLANHQAAIQGVLGLTDTEGAAILADAGAAVTMVGGAPSFSLANISLCYRYSLLAKSLELPVADLIALKVLSGLNPFQPLSGSAITNLAGDVLRNQTLAFLTAAAGVASSGFTVEDLQFLLRHQFDPVGKYQADPNALNALVQSVANGLAQIRKQNMVPAGLAGLPETLTDQRLSGLFPAAILKSLFAQLTDAQTYTATQSAVAPASAIDAAPFAAEDRLTFAYDAVTQIQTVTCRGLLLDWQRDRWLLINNSPLFTGLLAALQKQAQTTFAANAGNILGVWASLARYEAVTSAPGAVAAGPVTQADAALSLRYDAATQLQWLAYRGVLTDAKKTALTAIDNTAPFTTLLNNVQAQSMPAYRELLSAMLAMLVNSLTFQASQSPVLPANQIDPSVFAAFPQLQFAYDDVSQTQTLVYRGALADADRIALAALIPGSVALASLLQSVRNAAIAAFQSLATSLLTVTPADLDTFSAPFHVDAAQRQKAVKADLVTVFLPLLSQKLSRDFVTTTLAANLSADPSLTGSLITDAGLLSDPSDPGKSILDTFLATANQGVTATYWTSSDQSGAVLASDTPATADTAGHPTARSARFEGYMQVPVDGPYRFFAELGNVNAAVSLHIDPPDPTTLLDNPILSPALKAAKDHDEISQFVQLRGGALYRFTADFTTLGANGASVQIQGEHLPKGPLGQATLYSSAAITGFLRARMLLAKVLQIIQGANLDEREISYLSANSTQFGNLSLSALPTQAADDTVPKAVALFSQFLVLADYADLRKNLAGGADGLIDVFAAVGTVFTEPSATHDSNDNPATPWKLLANLSRRDPQMIRDVALHFGLLNEVIVGPNRQVNALGDFANNKGIRRIWQALQLLQIVGIPVAALSDATAIVSPAPASPDIIAGNLKNAVKAQYDADLWRPIAQSIFDKLRKRKRDALVSYLVNHLGLDSSNQLFEYFLIDPGMEPVVQTSRLRLALSSVQTFIQRCLLNLENGNNTQPERNVAPAVIDAEWWDWMKRYRVWEANRKIFLFPENWMEPELRLDKTDLFKTLEGALLEGDITRDLVEDAFFTYLKGLEVRARLDVVSMYLDQDPNHLDISTLYVLARTYGTPHKYFYRTYSNGSWTGWEPVTLDIEGDHVTMAIWRGRLNLFWVTFIQKVQTPSSPSPAQSGDPAAASLPFGDLAGRVYDGKPRTQIQMQLHWSEYLEGKWSNRISTDPARYELIDTFDGFDPRTNIYIHVNKEMDSSGNEGAVLINLDFDLGGGNDYRSFRVTSKNCDPGFAMYDLSNIGSPYNASRIDASVKAGKTALDASVETHITSSKSSWVTEHILHTVGNFSVLSCANPVSPPFLSPSEPSYADAGQLVSPFFFKDRSLDSVSAGAFLDELTFFVQPSLTEKTIVEWESYGVAPGKPSKSSVDLNDWRDVVLAQVPWLNNPNPPDPDSGYSIYEIGDRGDWLTNPATVVAYGDSWVGQNGIQQAQGKGTARLGSGAVFVSKEGARLNGAQTIPGVALKGQLV
jgi:hypothetical protein